MPLNLPNIDFEAYCEAGYRYDPFALKWRPTLPTAQKGGLPLVGASVYTEHPTCEALCLAYDLRQGRGRILWIPGTPDPVVLFEHIARGGLVEAHNSGFEYKLWNNVCVPKYGWPALPLAQLRCSMAKAYAFSVPGALKNAAVVLRVTDKKIDDGTRLLDKFSKPRKPTKANAALRLRPEDDPDDARRLYNYCLGDIKTEAQVSAALPDLSSEELDLWLTDQQINNRGVYIDMPAVQNCISIVEQTFDRYTNELRNLTSGAVGSANELDKLRAWMEGRGVITPSVDAEHIADMIKRTDLPRDVYRAAQIRSILSSASVKKLYAIALRTSRDGRLRDLFQYCGADRTGRWAGRGPQPHNLPKSGPEVGGVKWSWERVEPALAAIASRNLGYVESIYGDALDVVSGCLRGLFVSAPGHDLICSDYCAIEAVVLAALAGEEWRLEVFRTHGKIYEMSASAITGIPFEDFMEYRRVNDGDHHPLRNKVGKVAELASGYQGAVGAWKKFGADDHFDTDDDILAAVRAWRAQSPMIVAFWKGMEDSAVQAIQNPGSCYAYRSITFGVQNDILHCLLPSGRMLRYHEPRLHLGRTPWGKQVLKITYMGWDSKTKSWVRKDTYGGSLTENVTQAIARDVQGPGIVRVERAGYPVVLHVHDEIVAEVLAGRGDVGEFERLMATMPVWAAGWPIRAAGGWRGHRYRKG